MQKVGAQLEVWNMGSVNSHAIGNLRNHLANPEADEKLRPPMDGCTPLSPAARNSGSTSSSSGSEAGGRKSGSRTGLLDEQNDGNQMA